MIPARHGHAEEPQYFILIRETAVRVAATVKLTSRADDRLKPALGDQLPDPLVVAE